MFEESQHAESDAVGYAVGDYVYHVAPAKYADGIRRSGFLPKSGRSVNGAEYENRVYFATSLIAAYDISVNFGSYRDDGEYVIFKVDSRGLAGGYEEDPLFVHGIYVDYAVPSEYIVDAFPASDLFGKYDDADFDKLYEKLTG